MPKFEHPPGSGRVAHYSEAEHAMMKGLIAQAARGEITGHELQQQINVIHDLKVDLGATLVEDEHAEPEPVQESIFGIPNKAREKLGMEAVPDFDGATIDQARDKPRLFPQLQRVGDAMKDGKWRTLYEVRRVTGDPEASISARLRDFRKPKFGAHTVEREYVDSGLHRYRLLLNQQTPFPVGYGDPTVLEEPEETDEGRDT